MPSVDLGKLDATSFALYSVKYVTGNFWGFNVDEICTQVDKKVLDEGRLSFLVDILVVCF